MINNILTGAASGVAAQKIGSVGQPDHQSEQTETLAAIHNLLAEIKDALDVVTSSGHEANYWEIVNLSPGYEYLVDDHSLKHTALFSGSGSNSVVLLIPGLGSITYALNLGWNELNLPSGTRITTTTACTVLYRASNDGI